MTSAAKLRHVLSRDLHVLRNVAIKEVALRKALSLQNKSIYRILILNFNTNVNIIDASAVIGENKLDMLIVIT